YCGMCMFGCPYGLIYNSAQTLAELRGDRNLRYIGGQVVERVEESADGVVVKARPVEGGAPSTHEAASVFLGCGPIPTTKILMESLGIDECVIRDSQYFLAPLLQFRGSGAMTEDLHTLAQLFIEVNDPGVSERTVHLQVYTHNAIYEGELRRRFGRLYPLIPSGAILSRLLLLQGFLHSDDSVRVRIRRQGGKLHLKAGRGRRARRVINRVMRKLAWNAPRLGVAPLRPLLNIEAPGKSFHSGGTFPMRARPGPGECDTLGRPYGLKRVHAIDSTTFPSIPATTITLSIMANAYRIGSEYDRADA
ncbi:MAG TPA: GMC oxidoreductase, partial [Dehalococcoidia bacterium]